MRQKQNLYAALEITFLCAALLSGCVLGWAMFGAEHNMFVMAVAGGFFTLFLLLVISLILDPDRIRARQSSSVLQIARESLEVVQAGFDEKSAQQVCEILYPATTASAVAITGRRKVIGYCGSDESESVNLTGEDIRTRATRKTLSDGRTRVLMTPQEIGLPTPSRSIRAAIIVPLRVGGEIKGTLKFYYPHPNRINETQVTMAEGFAELISTQLAALELEEQRKLAQSMELKALQSQINPHFLFNTINTIASFIRTDPEKARVMLREFAVFYRRTLENSSDLIELSREIEQTARYFSFEIARFGEERLELDVDVSEDVEDMLVPAFILQPLVENAVKHAMPSEGKLTIEIIAARSEDDVIIRVADDGIGMSESAREKLMHPESQSGLGIAVKNINDRLKGFFGKDSYMATESEPGRGTAVTIFLKDAAVEDETP